MLTVFNTTFPDSSSISYNQTVEIVYNNNDKCRAQTVVSSRIKNCYNPHQTKLKSRPHFNLKPNTSLSGCKASISACSRCWGRRGCMYHRRRSKCFTAFSLEVAGCYHYMKSKHFYYLFSYKSNLLNNKKH